jgi:hypothetical protein
MVDYSQDEQKEDLSDVKTPHDVVKRWLEEIRVAKKEFAAYQKSCDDVDKAYLANTHTEDDFLDETTKHYAILWANHQTVKPSLYNGSPVTQVKRRHSDRDPVARTASTILERATEFTKDDYPFDAVMREAVDHFFMYSRGQARVVYDAEIEELPDGNEVVRRQEVKTEIISRDLFLHEPTRRWEDVTWVCFSAELNKLEVAERFGAEVAGKLKYDRIDEEDDDHLMERGPEHAYFAKTLIHEIWDKRTKQQIFVAPCYKEAPIEVNDDPLKLHDFFPCPKPLYGTLEPNKLVPVPEFNLWKDQAKELDEISSRISGMFKGIKLVGVAPGNFEEAANIIEFSHDGQVICIKNWTVLQQKGGIERLIQWLPIDTNIQVVRELYQQREALVKEIYELSGISDLMRGVNNPNATATAEQTKAKYSGLRLEDKQQLVEDFARDLLSLKAEIIAEQFDEETLYEMASVEGMENEEMKANFPDAVELLRNDLMRSFRLTVETNSTRAVDEQAKKQAMMEYVQTVGQYLNTVVPIAAQYPALQDFLAENLLKLGRTFHIGRNGEATLETALQQLKQGQGVAQQQQAPDPASVRAQVDMQKVQQELGFKMQELQQENRVEMNKLRTQIHETAAKIELEREKLQQDYEIKMKELEIREREIAIKEAELGMRHREHIETVAPVPQMKPFTMTARHDENGNRIYEGMIQA